MYVDMPLDELLTWTPEVAEPEDFDEFWATTLAENPAGEATFTPAPEWGLEGVDVYDVRFPGFAGAPIAGWYLRPRGGENLPGLVQYVGYNGGRGFPYQSLTFPTAGFAYLIMDNRGQGNSAGWIGVTPDPGGTGPQTAGYLTRGIQDAHTHHYRRHMTDAVRAVDALRQAPGVDPERIGVVGGSQGGGLGLAAAGLRDDVRLAMLDVPFLCHYRRAVGITNSHPYSELRDWLAAHRDEVEPTFRTLSYLDGVNFARRAGARARFTVALMDDVCPPSTVMAAYNAWPGEKELGVYEFNGHEAGGEYDTLRKITLAREVL